MEEDVSPSHDKLRPILQDYWGGIADNESTYLLFGADEGGREKDR